MRPTEATASEPRSHSPKRRASVARRNFEPFGSVTADVAPQRRCPPGHGVCANALFGARRKGTRIKTAIASQLFRVAPTRRLVKTFIGQLVERFHLEKVKARDLWHLTSRINQKLLAQSPMVIRYCLWQCRCAPAHVALWLKRHSNNPLCFQQLISD